MAYETATGSRVTTCVSFCDTTRVDARAYELENLLLLTCGEAGFPSCERVYVGSYFCENYFLGLQDSFHEAIYNLREKFGFDATLVVPIAGQAFIGDCERRVDDLLTRFDDVYDEVVVNDVASFMRHADHAGKRLGLGRLFSKGLRDARYSDAFFNRGTPSLSPEARACLQVYAPARSIVEVDPANAVVDVSNIMREAIESEVPAPEIAMHLPYCYATTGRNCSMASAEAPDSGKFLLGRACRFQCLEIEQGSRVDAGIRYAKHGRSYFFDNPTCAIAGTDAWRIVFSVGSRGKSRLASANAAQTRFPDVPVWEGEGLWRH